MDIVKGISEIMDKKDPATGSSGGLLTGLTKGVNEVLDKTINKIPTFGAPKNEYASLGDPNKTAGGIAEYQLTRDLAQATNNAFLDSPGVGVGLGVIPGVVAGIGLAVAKAAIARRIWDTDIREPTVRINSVLEERSYIDFYFPNKNAGRRRVAFFENAKIREDRSSRYASQNIVARNEPVRLFIGADARRVKVDFTYTLPHIEYFFRLCNAEALAGFKSYPDNSPGNIGLEWQPQATNSSAHLAFVKAYLDKFFGTSFNARGARRRSRGAGPTFYNPDRKVGPRAYEPTFQTPEDGYSNFPEATHEDRLLRSLSKNYDDLASDGMMAVYYTQFVIDTLRASVVGDTLQQGPAGPPIVRFRHGTVFNEAPFIVKNISIDYPSDKGFEYRTLMPRQVRFSLTLEEFRQTHGSHHGNVSEQVPDASQILDLTLNTSNPLLPLTDRKRGLQN